MLQQTRVETVIPYFRRFLERFPTVESLAAAPEQEVLELWAGLGYYRRARHLHRAARQVVELGGFPDTVEGLRRLAGVGEYTAAAVASIVFGRDAVAVDGNLRRVVARLVGLETPPERGPGLRAVRCALEERLPSGRAGDFNQALMDLGARICLASTPRCAACPLAFDCVARERGLQAVLPVRPARKPPKDVRAVALIVRCGAAVLLTQRPADGLLGGLWGPPDRVVQAGKGEDRALSAFARSLDLDVSRPRPLGELEHVFTHQRWRVAVYGLDVDRERPQGRWWEPTQPAPPLSRLATRILALGKVG